MFKACRRYIYSIYDTEKKEGTEKNRMRKRDSDKKTRKRQRLLQPIICAILLKNYNKFLFIFSLFTFLVPGF